MCTVCGCNQPHSFGRATPAAGRVDLSQALPARSAPGSLHFGQGSAGVHVPGLSQTRIIEIEQDILGRNNQHAAAVRQHLAARHTRAINLLSGPGAGKTTLLVETLRQLRAQGMPLAVIEGDQQTSRDAERIRATGVPALQINTGKGCHLDASMIERALAQQAAPENGLLFIENVGNLVCPAAYDLGEAAKVVLLSVTEGEDKPLKYPDMFAAADLVLITKIDLLPHLNFDLAACLAHLRAINPHAPCLQLSATSGEGMAAWLEFWAPLNPS